MKKRSRGEEAWSQAVIVQGDDGLQELHLVVSAEEAASSRDSIVDAFESAIRRRLSDSAFSGRTVVAAMGGVFVPDVDDLPSVLAVLEQLLQDRAKQLGLKASNGSPIVVHVRKP